MRLRTLFVLVGLLVVTAGRPAPAGAGLNALSLAETCGLARETARTKLRRMTEAGLLAVSEAGLLHLPDPDAAHREYGALDPIAVPRP